MKINSISNIVLKGKKWRSTLERYKLFFVQKNQPNYSIFVLSAIIGVTYDKQRETVLENDEILEEDKFFYVPKNVLDNHIDDITELFQTAILSSTTVNFSSEERLSLAFNPECRIDFDEMNFLIKFANFGIEILNDLYDEEPTTMMENWIQFLEKVHEDKKSGICSIDIDDL